MARVVAPFNPADADAFERQAIELAGDAAWLHEAGEPPPKLIENEGLLLAAFAAGQRQGDEHAAFMEANPPLAWLGSWTSSLDGRWETRPCVAEVQGQYQPGLLTSFRGGDSASRYGTPTATLAEAIKSARALALDWHRGYC